MSIDELNRLYGRSLSELSRDIFELIAERLGRRDFTLIQGPDGIDLRFDSGHHTGLCPTIEKLVERAKGELPEPGSLEETVLRLGFEDVQEFHRLVASADISTHEKFRAFKKWQDLDGSKRGLLALGGT